MHRGYRLALLVTVLVSYAVLASGQMVIDSPPTVIPFQGSFSIEDGTTVNAYDGAQVFARLHIQDGTLNLLGGELDQGVDANSGATVNIHDGNIAAFHDFLMSNGSTTTMRGGRFSDTIRKQAGATLVIEGVDFRLNGVSVQGLASPGDEASIGIPVGTLFTGIFANGAPFTFDSQVAAGDQFAGNVLLRQSVRPTGPAVVNLPADPIPPGVLPGQTLNVYAGAALPDAYNAAPGSVVNLEGGEAHFVKFYGAEFNVNSGNARTLRGYAGSTIRLNGGTTFQVSADRGSTIIVDGGTLGTLAAFPDTHIQINGGVVERLDFFRSGSEAAMHGGAIVQSVGLVNGSTFYLSGGTVNTSLGIPSGAKVHIRGGAIGQNEYAPISTATQAELTLVGRAFTLDGQPIPGLNDSGDSIIFTDRPDETLDAILADGSPLKLYVGTVLLPQGPTTRNLISPGSTLRLVLVPEPGTLVFVLSGLFVCAIYRRWVTSAQIHASR